MEGERNVEPNSSVKRSPRAIEEAEVRRLDDPLSLPDLLRRYPRRRGTATIRAILDEARIGATITRSELDERFLTLIQSHSLPSPALNVALKVNGEWIEADCVWREQRLVVELDGHAMRTSTNRPARGCGENCGEMAVGPC